jgi:hypothetical protein
MKLYDVPCNTKIRVIGDIKIPPSAIPIKENEILNFLHIDGMYSLCKNCKGDFVHLVAWAEVEIADPVENCMNNLGYIKNESRSKNFKETKRSRI